MLSLITFLTTSKYGKYVLEIVVVFTLVFGAYKYAEHQGAKNQQDKDEQKHSVEIEKARKDASDAKDQLVAQANREADAARADKTAAQQQFATWATALTALDKKSSEAHSQVAKLTDSELHGDIISKLEVRKLGDTTPGYFPQEERQIDDAVTQYPLEVQRNVKLQGEVDAKAKEAKANDDLSNSKQKTIDAVNNYLQLVLKDYRELYNQHPPRFHSAACLFLWSCGKKTLPELKLPEVPK